MKKTYIQLLNDILNELDYRELKLSISRFDIKQMSLRLEKKKGSISKNEIEVIEKLYDGFRKEIKKWKILNIDIQAKPKQL